MDISVNFLYLEYFSDISDGLGDGLYCGVLLLPSGGEPRDLPLLVLWTHHLLYRLPLPHHDRIQLQGQFILNRLRKEPANSPEFVAGLLTYFSLLQIQLVLNPFKISKLIIYKKEKKISCFFCLAIWLDGLDPQFLHEPFSIQNK